MEQTALDLDGTFVRVLGTRLGRFVEFEFSICDQALAIELVMPFSAFGEFCKANRCTVLAAGDEAQRALERLSWRERQPGLYRRPDERDDGEG